MPRTGSGATMAATVAVTVAVLASGLAACGPGDEAVVEVPAGTEDDAALAPTPLGPSIAVVVPGEGSFSPLVLAEVRGALEEVLARETDREGPGRAAVPLASGRVVVASDPAELRDQVAVLAETGTDVICVVGGVGADALRDAERLHARPTSCELLSASAPADAAERRLTVGIPIEGVGRVLARIARVAARDVSAAASGAASGAAPSVIAIVTGEDPALGGALRRGALEAAGSATVVVVTPETDRAVGEVVAGLVAASVDVVIVDGMPGAEALVEAALGAGLSVVAPEAVVAGLPEPLAAGVAATWRLRWDRVLEALVARVRAAPGPGMLELALADAVEVRAGPGAGPALLATLDELLAEEGAVGPRAAPVPAD